MAYNLKNISYIKKKEALCYSPKTNKYYKYATCQLKKNFKKDWNLTGLFSGKKQQDRERDFHFEPFLSLELCFCHISVLFLYFIKGKII